MCTVTYIPQSDQHFILTSNRDEAAHRSPRNITATVLHNMEMIFPKDAGAGGTWIATAADGRVVCLLNGAFEKHQHNPPYRRSRGLMVLDYFSYQSTTAFYENYDFKGMEPFTFIMVGQDSLHELRWDEKETHFKELSRGECYLWSSANLYIKEVREKREGWFKEWQKNTSEKSLKAIQEFHLNGGDKDAWNGFIMNRMNLVQTVSITNIVKGKTHMEMVYHDLLRENILSKSLLRKKHMSAV